MPSPFPGMDPYLESADVWHDFHGVFVTLLRLELSRQLRGRYQVRMDDNVYVHELDAPPRQLLGRPDVQVAGGPTRSTTAVVATLDAPVQVEVPIGVDVLREKFLEIRDAGGQRLITVVEVLSPANKRPGPDREQYLGRRRQYLTSDVNLVEIDLLRGGPRLPAETLPVCDYLVLVSPGSNLPHAGVWPISLRDTLPVVPIPLTTEDGSAGVDLQAIFTKAFDEGGYAPAIHQGEPETPLKSKDAAWAEGLLRIVNGM